MRRRPILHVVYDGGCGFCVRALRPLRAIDVFRSYHFIDGRDAAAVRRLFPSLDGADFDSAMFVHVSGEAPYRGFFAFRRMLWAAPPAWPLLPLFYAPFAAALGQRVYAWVARNRRSLGCHSDTCALTPPDVPAGQ